MRHGAGETRLVVGAGVLARPPRDLAGWLSGRRVFALTTRRVRRLHGAALAPLQAAAAEWTFLGVPEGEPAKSLAAAEQLWRRMLRTGGRRDARIVAFGGGSAGDLAGFVAGAFLRGIEYAQLPTTLLAQVDASIGGKTAVNLPEAKNSVGLFHHPAWVVADTSLLGTLPGAELRSGMVEVVKMAALLDSRLLGRVERDLERLLAGDPGSLVPVVAAAAAAKIRIVEADPRDTGVRRLLNFGHTLGHALETVLGYRRLRHGEAVGYGMLFALRLALARGLEPVVARRLAAIIARLGLPPLPPLEAAPLLAIMERDKKARRTGLAWVLPGGIGAGKIVENIPRRELLSELERFLREPFEPAG